MTKEFIPFHNGKSDRQKRIASQRGRGRSLLETSARMKYDPIPYPSDDDKELLVRMRQAAPKAKEEIIFSMLIQSIEHGSVLTIGQILEEMRRRGMPLSSHSSSEYFLRNVTTMMVGTSRRIRPLPDPGNWENTELILCAVPILFDNQ